MRWLFGSLASLALAVSAAAADVTFARVWPQWHDADAFDRIGEYFGANETAGRGILLRTHPEERAGLYFLVRVKSASPVEGKFVLDVVRPESPEAKSYTFPISLPSGSKVAELGLTGSDWPAGRDAHPVAWRLTLVNKSGDSVATQHSFLWAQPSK